MPMTRQTPMTAMEFEPGRPETAAIPVRDPEKPALDMLTQANGWAGVPLSDLAIRACSATLTRVGLTPLGGFTVSLLACDDARIAELNAEFRGKATPTNVLSWPSDERAAAEDGARPALPSLPMDQELGDIAIAFETCAREACDQGKPLADHVTHLLVHGVLHLLGYDHVRDKDAALMEGLETEILASLGVKDPYS